MCGFTVLDSLYCEYLGPYSARCSVQVSGFSALGLRVRGCGLEAQGFGLRILGLRAQGLAFRA